MVRDRDSIGAELPVYPFAVDIPAEPERRYLAGIWWLSRLCVVSILLSVALALALMLRSLSLSSRPYFIYWDKYDTQFRMMERSRASTGLRRGMSEAEYLNEYFVRDYLERTFSVSPIQVENEREWCACREPGGNAFESPECYICRFSETGVYQNFAANQKPALSRLAEAGIRRSVHILDVEAYGRWSPSSGDSLLSLVMPESRKILYTDYRIDFVLEDTRDGRVVGREAMVGYISTAAPADDWAFYRATGASYMFHPNYELVLERYLERGAE